MITHLTHGLREILASRGMPFPVLYAPERAERESYGCCVLARRARGGDVIESVTSTGGRNAAAGDRRAGWQCAGEIDVYAASPEPGAAISNHEDFGDKIVEMVVCAALDWAQSNQTIIRWGSAGYVPESSRSEEEQAPGVLYRMQFTIGRGIFRHGWDYALPTNADIGDVQTIEGPPP